MFDFLVVWVFRLRCRLSFWFRSRWRYADAAERNRLVRRRLAAGMTVGRDGGWQVPAGWRANRLLPTIPEPDPRYPCP
jgi:hypothetical protein